MASQELKLIFPNSQRMNRGNHVIKELVDACRANDCTDIVIVHEHRGDPGISLSLSTYLYPSPSLSLLIPSTFPRFLLEGLSILCLICTRRWSHRVAPAVRSDGVLWPFERRHTARHPHGGEGLRSVSPSALPQLHLTPRRTRTLSFSRSPSNP